MKFLSLLLLSLMLNFAAAQTNIDETVLLESNREQDFYIAANEGDQIILEVKRTDGKKISEFSLKALNSSNNVFTERNFKKFKAGITSLERSVYQLHFENKTTKPVAFTVKVGIETHGKPFAELGYKTLYDTIYGPEQKVMETVESFKTKTIQKENFYLNSKSNALVKGGKDRAVFPVYLPENTQEWFYVLTANRDEDAVRNTAKTFSLASELSKYLDTKVSTVSNAVTNLNAPPGAHICDVYLLKEEQANLFRERENFTFYMDGTRENYKSGIVQVKEMPTEKLFLGIKNPDNLYGIHVGIEVVAVIKQEETIVKFKRTPEIHKRKVPFVK
ncbi:hypothetical protein HX109_04775 [Galbibacter sp. BG1]|uniref:hypothetical protein n=1 Tax=Galbibacter sp. BG1 TaxID=1170699 RepID=UPI0015B8FB38|nr:hypothetical protein [Galbibacter sp. BG1]QLE00914.1 hypothetical protein HX109_04775 [Galbibacter sp. BG1]